MLGGFDWQTVAAFAVVAVAAGWLLRRTVRFCRRAGAGVGSCHGCSAADAPRAAAGRTRPLVQIGSAASGGSRRGPGGSGDAPR